MSLEEYIIAVENRLRRTIFGDERAYFKEKHEANESVSDACAPILIREEADRKAEASHQEDRERERRRSQTVSSDSFWNDMVDANRRRNRWC